MTIFSIVGVISGPAGGVYAWFASRSQATADEIDVVRDAVGTKASVDELTVLRTKLADQDKRLLTIESEMRHMPDKELVTDIRLSLAKLEGTVGQFGEKLNGVARIAGIIDQQLRDK